MAAVWAALLSLCLVGFLAAPAQNPTGHRDSTRHLNAFLATYHADVGSSVPLGDGRVLWLFGDTVRADGGFDRNSAAVQYPDGQFRSLPGTFADHPLPDHWYWPGTASRSGNRLRMLAMDFTCDEPCGAWDMRYQHTDVLTYRLPDLTPLGRVSLPRRPTGAMWSQLYPAHGGVTYVFGSYAVLGRPGKAVEVARVPTGRLADPAAWNYLGTKLGPELELGTVMSVVRTAEGHRLYSKRLDLWSDEIISYDGPTPHGPWSNRRVVATTPRREGMFTYAVEAHPEQPSAPGRLLLTYATNCKRLCGGYHVTAITVAAPGVLRDAALQGSRAESASGAQGGEATRPER
ncbi:hypothetical protein [Streptomyces cupreus]|uniref:DUF4185 domain-containing protein n=1 Tax=Streptomyces cupreus TaxID=2759956 RepID=A0A7X1J3U1_9ACTN|nr:hypothetical protein [Streptomyces cupreus]MBC2903703.1 hypothetical protein [Streptomyces cupreus]